MKRLLLRVEALWKRLRSRLLRRELVPGRFERGRAASRRGSITTAPIVPSERDYLVYVPRGYSRWRRAPLVVMCHGCKQTPEAFAELAAIAVHALAAVMGLRHPRLVRGVVTHSGLACGAASTAATAIAVMAHGPDNDVARIADGARAARRDESLVPLLVIQGDRDDVVAPANGVGLVAQYLRFNGHPAGETGYQPAAALPASDASARETAPGVHPLRIDAWMRDGHVVVRHVTVEGLGHAWSGGSERQPFGDPLGPDALALFVRFAGEAAA